jgi:ribosomal protein L29
LQPNGPKGHFAFSFPILPDEGEKDTQFQITYSLPYSDKFTFRPEVTLPAQSVGVLLPKAMKFAAGSGSVFQTINQDPNIQTFVAKNAVPGKALEFTVTGTGSMPREEQGAAASGGQTASAPGNQPGGGIGVPIGDPDPLSKYKWWILGGLALVLVAAAAFLLRKPAGMPVIATLDAARAVASSQVHGQAFTAPVNKNSALLNALKEELFALESEKLTGNIAPAEYTEVKAALETVLKRALKHSQAS